MAGVVSTQQSTSGDGLAAADLGRWAAQKHERN